MCSATEPAEIVSAALYCSSPFARASQQFSSNEERKQRQQVNAGVNGTISRLGVIPARPVLPFGVFPEPKASRRLQPPCREVARARRFDC